MILKTEISILEALVKAERGEGYLIIRNPFSRGQKSIEFIEVEKI